VCVCVKGVYRCRFRCLQILMSNVGRAPCQCRCKCRKYIDLSRKKSPKKPQSYVEKMQNHMLIYVYIYTHTHTHIQTHNKAHFSSIFTRQSAKKLGTDKMSMSIEKTCKCGTYVDVDGSSKCRPDMVYICIHP